MQDLKKEILRQIISTYRQKAYEDKFFCFVRDSDIVSLVFVRIYKSNRHSEEDLGMFYRLL